jgi:hypothetical protein
VEILGAERLGDVFVRTSLQPELDVLLRCARGEEDDRQRLRRLRVSEPTDHFEARELRHCDVEDRCVWRARLDELERFLAVSGEDDFEAGTAKTQGDQRENVLVVVRDEHERDRPHGGLRGRGDQGGAEGVHVLDFGRRRVTEKVCGRRRFGVIAYPFRVRTSIALVMRG